MLNIFSAWSYGARSFEISLVPVTGVDEEEKIFEVRKIFKIFFHFT